MAKYKKYFLPTLILSVTLFITLSYPAYVVNKIVVDNREYLFDTNTKVNIHLEYRHSVELTEIIEEYELRGCSIVLEKFTWPGYGAGLPSRYNDTRIQVYTSEGFTVTNMTLGVSVLQVELRYMVQPKLLINGLEVMGDRLIIETCTRISIMELLRYRLWR
jgi:hypothetical protein